MIDLTGGEVKVLGNAGDAHSFRLTNPSGETIIETDGEYSADFRVDRSRSTPSSVTLDLSELDDGVLILPITIQKGFYRIRRLNPIRTLLIVEVEAR